MFNKRRLKSRSISDVHPPTTIWYDDDVCGHHEYGWRAINVHHTRMYTIIMCLRVCVCVPWTSGRLGFPCAGSEEKGPYSVRHEEFVNQQDFIFSPLQVLFEANVRT